MVFHGAIVVVLGLLLGFPYAMALLSDPEGDVRAWRMAHLEGILNGLLVIAVAAVGRHLNLVAAAPKVLAWSLIGMAYGNVVASALGATFGVRGLEPAGPAVNVIVYVLFVLAIVAVFVGMGLVAYGARPEPRPSANGGEEPPSDPTGEPTLDLSSPTHHSHRRRRRRRRRGPRPGSGETGSSPP